MQRFSSSYLSRLPTSIGYDRRVIKDSGWDRDFNKEILYRGVKNPFLALYKTKLNITVCCGNTQPLVPE